MPCRTSSAPRLWYLNPFSLDVDRLSTAVPEGGKSRVQCCSGDEKLCSLVATSALGGLTAVGFKFVLKMQSEAVMMSLDTLPIKLFPQ